MHGMRARINWVIRDIVVVMTDTVEALLGPCYASAVAVVALSSAQSASGVTKM
jgi:hypothetical protein